MPYIKVQGKDIFYRQNDKAISHRPTILCVHGAGGTGEKWANQLSGIKDYHLIALDLPGHGLSEGEAINSIQSYKEYIWEFAQAIELKSFVITGHSMGGAIAMQFALDYPDWLKGLIIVDSGGRLRVNPVMLESLSRGEHLLESVQFSYSPKAAAKILEDAVEEMRAVSTQVLWADFQACNNFNVIESVQRINLPTLVICGQEDRMTPVKYSEYLAQQIPQALLALIPDAGHMSMIEQPEAVNKAIMEFMHTL
ncbi:putative hydrolase or acyltransferase of alpha/beta superfamily [Desulfitobacterium dehalogenans ATCC 51507]|uniref:Putative hydrolase or acyltransferase of alpha/beta superfamily n=1 Tax=Desulfitobacterium dehalogenans (strain ATCC 51507 / DSM 9161 / JW/IU-DC1) TaxID=756499 RepID=I4AC72_DESDJ|nr:alpha/beta hydrolase [Desulfitobacterium dehalogenans]AFM01557.1 putative hydrolase or acyltransferase of alpha/beta superfamily [Desulfitobacterium dehalogenans ATCC 51507]